MARLKRKRSSPQKQARVPESTPNRSETPEQSPPANPSRTRRWVFRALSFFGVPILLLAGFEICLRIAGIGYPTAYFLRAEIGGKAVLVENSQFGRRFFPKKLMRRPPPVVLEPDKLSGTYRIFVFGESAAMGDPDPSFSFSRILQVLLRDRFPGTEFEIINTAFTAINSHVILPIAQECARQDGDLWIVYMGNNEVAGPFGPATVFGAQPRSLGLIRAGIALKSYRTGQLLESLRERHASGSSSTPEWGGLQMFLNNQIAEDDSRLAKVYDSFQRNLEDILEAGLRFGTKVIISTVASNLRDCPPFASVHSAQLNAKSAPEWKAGFLSGIEQESGGRIGEALDAYREAAKMDPNFAELQFRIGRSHLALGETNSARVAFENARDLDALRFRTDTRMNTIVEETSRKWRDKGVRLARADQAFQEAAKDGIPGDELFFDHVHLTFAGNYRLALAIAREILAVLPDTILQLDTKNWASEDECGEQLALTGWNRIQLLEGMRQRLSEAPFTNQLNHAVRQQRFREQLDQLQPILQASGLDHATERYRSALQAAPRDFQLRQNFANFLFARKLYSEAVAEGEKVLEFLPHHPDVHHNLGVFLTAAGAYDEAEKQFRNALALNPDSAAAYIGLGKAQVNQGKEREAIESFSSALIRNPKEAESLLNVSQLWQKAGDLTKAREYILKGLEVQPRSFAIQMQMGDLLSEEGDLLQAAKHFAEAVKLQPEHGLTYFADQVRQQPEDARANFFLANAMAARNERAASFDLLKKSVELDGGFWEARYFLGVELAAQNRVDEAQLQFAGVVRAKPGFARGHLNLGVALARRMQWNEARAEFEQTLKLDPTNEQARQYLATIQKMLR